MCIIGRAGLTHSSLSSDALVGEGHNFNFAARENYLCLLDYFILPKLTRA